MNESEEMPTETILQRAAEQRRLAEARVKTLGHRDPATLAPEEAERLLHELHVHQIELEMRNEELLRTQEKYRTLTESMKDVVWVLDPLAGRFLYVSPSVLALRGYTAEEVLAQPAAAALTPESAERVNRIMAQGYASFRSGRRSADTYNTTELEQPCKDGSTVWTEAITHYVLDDATGGIVVHGVSRDISERKRVEETLRASESRYRDLYENAPVAYFSVGPDGRIRRCNRQAARMLGYTIEQLVGRPVFDLYPDTADGKPRARQVFQRFLAREPVAGEELRMMKADGTLIWISLSVTAILDAAGEVVESRSSVIDITERKEAEALLEARVQERTRDLQAEIAERAAAQAALQRSQASLAEAERIAHLGSWELDLSTGELQPASELQLSDEARRIYGFAPAPHPITVADVDNAIHPDDRAAVQAARQRGLRSDQAYSVRYRIVLPGGEVRMVHVVGEARRAATGRSTHAYGMAQDITEQEQVKAALARRVRELTSLQELGRIVSFELSLEDIIRVYLERLVTLAGLDLAQVFLLREGRLHLAGASSDSGRSTAQAQIPEVSECLCGLAAQEGRTVYSGGIDGHVHWARSHCCTDGLHELAALPLRSGEAIIGVLAVAAAAPDVLAARLTFLETAAELIAGRLQNALLHREIQARAAGLEETVSERTRELQAERDRTQAILETVGESVVVTDLDGQLLFINPATTALTGHARDEELGRPLWHEWTEQARTEIWPEAQRALRTGQAWHGEVSGQQRNGATYVAALTATPLYDADVTLGPVGAVWAQRDVTMVKEAAQLKDQFVANVSHELRTPISIIALACDNLETFQDRLDEGQRLAIVRDIQEQTHRLDAIVADTLQIARIDAGRVPAEKRRLDLARLVREEATGLRPLIGRRGQELSVAAAAAVTVLGNEMQLRQIVRNLLDNATKYTLAGRQISCTCEVRAGALGAAGGGEAWAVVEVTDEGIGIASRDLPYLFERFYRVHSEGATPGTGLGLPIAQELVALHGGWISVASTHGQGSTFTVYLPLAGQEA